MVCNLCDRPLGDISIDRHHLIPKARGGKEIVPLHKICHRKIHATFTEKQLEKYYNTFDRLREHEEIQNFIKWVSKKPFDFYDGSKEANRRRR